MSSKTKVLPLYDIEKSYLENAEEGPFFIGDPPERQWPNKLIDFLGFSIASPIGVPAGPLLNAKWIELAGQLGYDILCYKTIRGQEYQGHPLPNMVHLNIDKQLSPFNEPLTLESTDFPSNDISVTNSFGMPSRSQEYLKNDIPLANRLIDSRQVMIVSVVGSPEAGNFIRDFVDTALFAKECGAKIIEANFSCPNVVTKEGSIATDPEQVYNIASRLVKALKETPLIIKVGTYNSPELMKQVFLAAAKAGVRAISGINTIRAKVINPQGEYALGPDRPYSGVCGHAIRDTALNFVHEAARINREEKLALTLIGVGGITQPEHFQNFLDAGADIAMSATGMMWNPYLAHNYHQE